MNISCYVTLDDIMEIGTGSYKMCLAIAQDAVEEDAWFDTLNGIKKVIIRDDLIGKALAKWERVTPNGAWKRTI